MRNYKKQNSINAEQYNKAIEEGRKELLKMGFIYSMVADKEASKAKVKIIEQALKDVEKILKAAEDRRKKQAVKKHFKSRVEKLAEAADKRNGGGKCVKD